MASLKHTHTFVQYKKRPGYWRCAHPHCNYIIDGETARGKATTCTVCGTNEFILDREAMRRVRPRCAACSTTKKAMAFQNAMTFMDQLLPPLGAASGEEEPEE
jgi:hypothetical protein